MVNSEAYFGSGNSSSPFEEKNSCSSGNSLSSRVTRGPMDQFVVDLDENDDEKSPNTTAKTITPATSHRERAPKS
ncbi:hypothetical protein PanWU01x14_098290, partial [Parasponia andersonii]